MNKFKPHDRIVLIKSKPFIGKTECKINTTYIVKCIFRNETLMELYGKPDLLEYAQNFEHEVLYNSKLYKVLLED